MIVRPSDTVELKSEALRVDQQQRKRKHEFFEVPGEPKVRDTQTVDSVSQASSMVK